MKIILPKAIEKQLCVIARNLWMRPSHACLMVGAGFSRNAIKTNSSVPTPPVWNALADSMLEEMHGKEVAGKMTRDYLDVLNVAEELVASKGRKAMDEFLEEKVPDDGLEPSELHKKLMLLPWTDVFTTNYDTLLERAADEIVSRNYERVVQQDKLVLSHSPRIIKLHGSFGTDQSYIISTEDYRRYPIDQAPFVNTMQQALIENTLCMFGFSGDDPNFLKWIGWIHDNLGKSMPKIYMIGPLNCNKTKRSLLKSRNIIPVDLAPICKKGHDTYDVLMSVVQYLYDKRVDPEEWGVDGVSENNQINLHRLVELYKSYPGWLIIPYAKRGRIINHIYSADITPLNDANNLDLAYYLNWILEKAALPLFDIYLAPIENIVSHHESVKYPESIVMRETLRMAMMRAYRERGKEELWMHHKEIVEKYIWHLNDELKSRYFYELCMYDVNAYDFEELREHLRSWGKQPMSYLWRAKRASLIAEFFDISKAQSELEKTLRSIREALNLAPIEGNYEMLYAESVVLFLLKRVKQSKTLAEFEIPVEEDAYTERMHELTNFYCDPLSEIVNFEKSIQSYHPNNGIVVKTSFDLGRVTRSYEWNRENKHLRVSAQYMRLIEELAIPLSLHKVRQYEATPMKVLIDNLTHVYPSMAASLIMRSGHKESVDGLFGRKTLSMMSRCDVDETLDIFLRLFKNIIRNAGEDGDRKYYKDTMLKVVPEVLSRLVTKASLNKKEIVIDLINMYNLSEVHIYAEGMNLLVKRLMNSLMWKEQRDWMEKFLCAPFPNYIPLTHEESVTYDFMGYVSTANETIVSVPKEKIEEMIAVVGGENEDDRKVACWRLYYMHESGMLTKQQTVRLAENIWSKVDMQTGLPINTPFTKCACIKIPRPAYIDAVELLRKYIRMTPFYEVEKVLAIGHGTNSHWETIIGTRKIDYAWEREDVRKLADDVLSWWKDNKDKLLIKEMDSLFLTDRHKEYEKRFIKIISIIENVVRPNWKFVTAKQKVQLDQMAYESSGYSNYALCLQTVLLPKEKIDEEWSMAVMKLLSTSNDNALVKASMAIQYAADRGCLPLQCADAMCESLAYKSGNNVDSILVAMHEAIRYGWKPTIWQQKCLYLGLKENLMKTMVDQYDTEFEATSKLFTRMRCAKLVSVLNKKVDISDEHLKKIVKEWLTLAKDENEFCEIRNALLESEIE